MRQKLAPVATKLKTPAVEMQQFAVYEKFVPPLTTSRAQKLRR